MKIPLRIVIAIVALALGIVPAAALANGEGNSQNAPGHTKSQSSNARSQAQKQCRQERTAMGTATFDKTFGTDKNGKNAFGKCVAHRTHQDQAAQNSSNPQQTESTEVKAEENAAKQCRTEQSADPAAFKTKYGTNKNGSNAFGKCVSQHARQREEQGSSGSGSNGS
jgi:hypothetical protein